MDLEDRIGRIRRVDRRIDRPERERRIRRIRRPRECHADAQLTPSQRDTGGAGVPSQCGAHCASDPKPHEKDRQNQRERVSGGAEEQRQHASPQDLRAKRRQTGQRDRTVHEPHPRRCSRHGALRPGLIRNDGVRSPRRNADSQQRHDDVQSHRGVGCGWHVIERQEEEPGHEAAGNGACEIASIEETQPRHTLRRGFDPAGDGRKRRSHEERRRQQANAGDHRSQDDADTSRSGDGGVQIPENRDQKQDGQPADADPQLQVGVDLERMPLRIEVPRQQQATQAHSAHEHTEQHR